MLSRNGLWLVALIPVWAMAEGAAPAEGVWTGKGQIGYVASQGNTESTSANAEIDTTLVSGSWKHAFHLGGLYGKNADVVSAERWDTHWQSDYNFSADAFVFGALHYEHDLFNGFAYQGTASAGMGYKFINTSTTKLSSQLGVGFRRSRPEQIVKDETTGEVLYRVPLDITNDAVFTAGLDYSQDLTATTNIANTLLIESGSSNTTITDTLALAVKISDKFALSLGYKIQHNSKPPADLKKLDTTETVNLVYAF